MKLCAIQRSTQIIPDPKPWQSQKNKILNVTQWIAENTLAASAISSRKKHQQNKDENWIMNKVDSIEGEKVYCSNAYNAQKNRDEQ